MNKLILFLSAITLLSCKQEEKPQYVVLTGTVENNVGETALVRGNDFESRVPISETGIFTDTLNIPTNGFYDLYVGRERTGVYLEKGNTLSVKLNAEEFDETLVYSGSLAKENNFMAAKYLWNEQHINFKEMYTADEEAFLLKHAQITTALDSLYASQNIKNESFKNLLDEEDKYSKASIIENYQEAHRYYSADANFKVSDSFLSVLSNIDYTDTLAFRKSVAYQSLLETHYNRLAGEDARKTENGSETISFLKIVDTEMPDGYAKDKLMTGYLQFGLKPDESLEEAYTIYKNSNPNPESFTALTERYNKLKTITKGNPSPTFNYENHKGGTTSLADLKDKYVYIDVWATWCGPCLREIPSLKAVEEAYHGKQIEFVSISIDVEKDYEKWKTMVTEKQLGGIQLMADNNWKSEFAVDYGILGIPRFILIDPQGNIVSADAPRPSDPELRKILDELI